MNTFAAPCKESPSGCALEKKYSSCIDKSCVGTVRQNVWQLDRKTPLTSQRSSTSSMRRTAPPNMDSAITQKATGLRSAGSPSTAMYVSTCRTTPPVTPFGVQNTGSKHISNQTSKCSEGGVVLQEVGLLLPALMQPMSDTLN